MSVSISMIPRRPKAREQTIGCMIAAAMLTSGAVAAAPATTGAEFTAVTRNQSTGIRFPAMGDATVRGAVDGARGRVEYVAGGKGVPAKGTVLITRDGGQTAKIYNEGDHSCGDSLTQPGAAEHPTTSFSYENLKIDKKLDEAGPKLFGMATRHVRYAISYDLTSSSPAKTLHGTIATEAWVAPRLADPAFSLWLGVAAHTGNVDADHRIAKAMNHPTGAALKRIQQTTLELGDGKEQTSTSTMAVTELKANRPSDKALDPPFECRTTTPKQ